MRAFALVLVSISFGLVALLLWRRALSDVGGFQLEAGVIAEQLPKLLRQWTFWLGALMLVGVGIISLDLWANEELSKVVPLYSMSYIAIAVIGKLFLNEDVSATRWTAILVIAAGVTLLSRT